MKVEKENHQGKQYKTTMNKISVSYYKQQTQFNSFKGLQNGQINDSFSEILNTLDSKKPSEVRQCLKSLGYLLTTTKKEYFQSIAHRFIPHVQKLILQHHKFSVVLASIKYLTTLVSFGNLNEECLKLFEPRIQMFVKIIKNGRAEYQCQLFILAANLAIDSVKMRDLLLQKGAVDAILQAFKQDLTKGHLHLLSSKFKQNAYSALIALTLGYPLPPRHKVEKVVNKVVGDIDDAYSYWAYWSLCSTQNACGAMWMLYHYSDFRDEQQCRLIIELLLRLTPSYAYNQQKKKMLEFHFNLVFMQIYEYHSDKQHNEIMPYLHGCCYSGAFQRPYYSQLILRQHTPKMYLQLFKQAIKHKMTKIGTSIVKPWKQAISFLRQEDDFKHRLLVLEFILWVLSPLIQSVGDIFSSRYKQLQYQQNKIVSIQFLIDIQQNLHVLKDMRHDKRRVLSSLSSAVIKRYHELTYNNRYCEFSIEIEQSSIEIE